MKPNKDIDVKPSTSFLDKEQEIGPSASEAPHSSPQQQFFAERSELTQEIISKKPDFIEKWALSVFLTLLLLLIALTYYINYPDLITGDAIVTGYNMPKEVVSGKEGKLSALLVKNEQRVGQGEIIGWVADSGNVKYPILAPMAGHIAFILPLRQDQYISEGKLLAYVNPVDSTYFIEIKLPQNSFGKVDTGMKVQLRFAAYPYQESGFVPGHLEYISRVLTDSGFIGIIRLEHGLVTSRGKVLPYRHGLKARALVVTKEQSLLKRIYYSFHE